MPLTLTLRAGLAISRLVFGPSIIQPLEKGRARLRWITWRPYELIPVKRVVDQIIAGPGGDLVVRIDEPDGTAPCPLLLFFTAAAL